jgi:hypothetical protein
MLLLYLEAYRSPVAFQLLGPIRGEFTSPKIHYGPVHILFPPVLDMSQPPNIQPRLIILFIQAVMDHVLL